ncbi:hypothetical protein Pelo_11791 [Pelomyxa schiedti]|nr:hypothetical protein Pelo_11791 [Pelomyxa schiedti]
MAHDDNTSTLFWSRHKDLAPVKQYLSFNIERRHGGIHVISGRKNDHYCEGVYNVSMGMGSLRSISAETQRVITFRLYDENTVGLSVMKFSNLKSAWHYGTMSRMH